MSCESQIPRERLTYPNWEQKVGDAKKFVTVLYQGLSVIEALKKHILTFELKSLFVAQ